MSAGKPLLVVLGATGKQGGSVLSYYLSQSPRPYALRGVTRDTSSPKSISLTSLGVEMVKGSFDDPASLETAFKGASVIFSVTDFWQSYNNPSLREIASSSGQTLMIVAREHETQQNKNIIDAASKTNTLERLIYSSMPNTEKLSGGKYIHTYHFDGKAIAEEYGQSTYPELWAKTSVFYAGYYLENYFQAAGGLVLPKLTKERDALVLSVADPLGSTPFPMYSSVFDTGALVNALIQAKPGKKVIGVNQWLNFRDFATILAEALGKDIQFVDSNPNLEFGSAEVTEDHLSMVEFCIEFGYDGGKVDKTVLQPSDLGIPIHLDSVKEWCLKQNWDDVLQVVE